MSAVCVCARHSCNADLEQIRGIFSFAEGSDNNFKKQTKTFFFSVKLILPQKPNSSFYKDKRSCNCIRVMVQYCFIKDSSAQFATVCEEGPGICALIMTIGSLLLIVVSLPVSLLFVVKVVQEYERAVIFRWQHSISIQCPKYSHGTVSVLRQIIINILFFQTGSAVDRRGQRAGCVLHYSLCGHLREDWPEDCHIRDPASGGEFESRPLIFSQSSLKSKSFSYDGPAW